MSFTITRDLYCNRLVSVRRDSGEVAPGTTKLPPVEPESSIKREGACWRGQINFHGGNEIVPETISQAVIDRLTKDLVALAENSKPAKNQKPDGMATLGQLRDIDKDLVRLQGSLARAQARLAELPQAHADAIRDSTDDGTLLGRLDALAGEKARVEATCQNLQVEIHGKTQVKAGLLSRFRLDRDASLQTAFAAERKAVHAALAEAWTEFEKVVGPTLQKVVEAQAKLTALEAPTTFGRIQIQLDHTLLGISPPTMTVTTVDVRGQPARPPVHAQQRERGAGQQLVTTYSTE